MDIIFVISFLATVFLLLYAIGYVFYVTKKDREFEQKRNEAYYNSARILNSARDKAKQIIEESEAKAQQVLLQAENIQQNIEGEFNQTLQQVVNQNSNEINKDSKQLLDDYKNSLTSLKSQYLKEIEALIAKMEGSMQNEFQEFRTVLEKDTKLAENTLGQNITAELDKTRLELETYKKTQIGKIDEMIKTMVVKISQEVLAKTITPQEHEKLIIEALNQAKNEGVLS